MPHHVVVAMPLPDVILSMLERQYTVRVWQTPGYIPEDVLGQWLAQADGVLCSLGTHFSRQTITGANRLRVISSVSVGVDHIDLAAATECGIPVGHTPGVLVDSTADLAIGLMLAATRRMPEADRFVRDGEWQVGWSTGFFLGTDLSRATVGLVGLGPIGQAVARRLQGFGCKVIGWNRTPRDVPGVSQVPLDEVFAQSDIVSLHTALSTDTAGMVSAERLATLRDGALVVNTARGGLIDESALEAELATGRLRAALDVYAEEPLPLASPLRGFDNVVLLPHLGSATGATRQAMIERALQNLAEGLDGDSLSFCANPDVYQGS